MCQASCGFQHRPSLAAQAHQTRMGVSAEVCAKSHRLHAEVGGWCIAFAIALCCRLRSQWPRHHPWSACDDMSSTHM